ncbi:hypothetical protein ACI2JA_08585 [Alkalihalobacillus sp. NPDC078783]
MNRTCNHCNQNVPLWKIILSNWRRVTCPHCKKRNYTTTSTQKLHNYFLLPVAVISGSITGYLVDSFVERVVVCLSDCMRLFSDQSAILSVRVGLTVK